MKAGAQQREPVAGQRAFAELVYEKQRSMRSMSQHESQLMQLAHKRTLGDLWVCRGRSRHVAVKHISGPDAMSQPNSTRV